TPPFPVPLFTLFRTVGSAPVGPQPKAQGVPEEGSLTGEDAVV
ncbi:hypothetical protein A2U01_0101709, partial [Trifolium medium]|nr:hypothetical protein [Trifolium medium]